MGFVLEAVTDCVESLKNILNTSELADVRIGEQGVDRLDSCLNVRLVRDEIKQGFNGSLIIEYIPHGLRATG